MYPFSHGQPGGYFHSQTSEGWVACLARAFRPGSVIPRFKLESRIVLRSPEEGDELTYKFPARPLLFGRLAEESERFQSLHLDSFRLENRTQVSGDGFDRRRPEALPGVDCGKFEGDKRGDPREQDKIRSLIRPAGKSFQSPYAAFASAREDDASASPSMRSPISSSFSSDFGSAKKVRTSWTKARINGSTFTTEILVSVCWLRYALVGVPVRKSKP